MNNSQLFRSDQTSTRQFCCVRRSCAYDRNYFSACSIFVVFIFFSLLGLSGCTTTIPLFVDHQTIWYGESSLKISFESNKPLEELEISTDENALVVKQQLAGVLKGESIISFDPTYSGLTFKCRSSDGEHFESRLVLPSLQRSRLSLRFLFQGNSEVESGILTQGSDTPLIFSFSKGAKSLQKISATISAANSLLLSSDRENWSQTLEIEECGDTIRAEFIKKIYLRAPENSPPGTFELQVNARADRAGKAQEIYEEVVKVSVMDKEELSRAVAIDLVEMPANAQGKSLRGMRNDYLVSGGGLLNLLGLSNNFGSFSEQPVSYQSVFVKNATAVAVPVIATAYVENLDGARATAFDVPANRPGPLVSAGAVLNPGERRSIVLPFFITGKNTRPGKYIRVISLRLAGTDLELSQKKIDLFLERNTQTALLVTLIVAGISLISLGLILIKRNSILRSFTTRQMVTIGLIASVSIILVNIPVYFLSSVTVFLLGPLGFLIDGLLSEFVFNALLVALMFIIPRQGTCAMLIGVRFLLGGVLLGMITPVGLLLSSVTALSLEAAVWLSGLTRAKAQNKESITGYNFRLVFLFAGANAAISWIGFQLSIVLLRLNYADWYVIISVVIGGFLYSFLGAMAGRKLSGRFDSAIT